MHLSERNPIVVAVTSIARRLTRLIQTVAIAANNANLLRLRLSWETQPNDIFIVSFPKSGTTWMQMIVHQLTSDGSLSFPHINFVCPYFETTPMLMGMPAAALTRPPGAPPRMFKTHLKYRNVPRGKGKYIYLIRNGQDVMISEYHHVQRFLGYQKPFKEFLADHLRGTLGYCGNWFTHVEAWGRNAQGLDVLYVHYEDLIRHFDREVRRVAEFCNLPLREEQLPRIRESCSFEFMRENALKLAPEFAAMAMFPKTSGFFRKGTSGDGESAFSPEMREQYRKNLQALGHGPLFDRYRGETAAAAPAREVRELES